MEAWLSCDMIQGKGKWWLLLFLPRGSVCMWVCLFKSFNIRGWYDDTTSGSCVGYPYSVYLLPCFNMWPLATDTVTIEQWGAFSLLANWSLSSGLEQKWNFISLLPLMEGDQVTWSILVPCSWGWQGPDASFPLVMLANKSSTPYAIGKVTVYV